MHELRPIYHILIAEVMLTLLFYALITRLLKPKISKNKYSKN